MGMNGLESGLENPEKGMEYKGRWTRSEERDLVLLASDLKDLERDLGTEKMPMERTGGPEKGF